MRPIFKRIAVVLSFVCALALCACDVQIDVNVGAQSTPSRSAQATEAPSASTEKPIQTPAPNPGQESVPPPSEMPTASLSPETDAPSLPLINDKIVLEELCEELSVEDSVSSPALFSTVYDVDAIA